MKKIFALCLLACFGFGETKNTCSVGRSNIIRPSPSFTCAGGYLFIGDKGQVLNSKGLPATCECIRNEKTKTLYNIKTDKGLIEWRDE